ncbi:hypothetical protein WJX73_005399 [Symbiochloris irregularis]|uniref:Major facilitator superfamily (MFS) profile domain-containing protein n=1 Tax=Symbiochloris irregularis TaxID=706552 RepID=A0AAW1NNR1_9CHLO
MATTPIGRSRPSSAALPPAQEELFLESCVHRYDNGVMGGVVAMDGFLQKFFPHIIVQQAAYKEQTGADLTRSLYCAFNDQILQLVTSVLFLAGTVCEISGTTAYLSRYHGRKRVMMYSGILFMIAAILLCAAEQISMIIIGRVFQGIAISFASVSVPIYNSEMAPPRFRGRLNQLYQIVLTGFILVAYVINLIINVAHATRWGWRFSLGFAFVPSFLLFLGGVFLPDSPNSLLERGYVDQARKNLEFVRGTRDVDKEFQHLVEAADLAKQVRHPWKNMFSRKYRPQLVLNIIIFYGPEIFTAFGANTTLSLVCGLIIGACNHLSTYVSFWVADYFGRRFLFLQAGVQMWGTFLFFAICVFVMTTFVYFFFVETKNVPLEECPWIFYEHWYWKRFAQSGIGFGEKLAVHRKMMRAEEMGTELNLPKGMEAVLAEVQMEIKEHGRLLTPLDMENMNVDKGAAYVNSDGKDGFKS